MHYPKIVPMLLAFLVLACNKPTQQEEIKASELITNPATASGTAPTSGEPVLSFAETSHDFGRIITGDKVQHSFLYTNTGTAPLIISDVKASCGCTVPSFSRAPLQPGQRDSIAVVFNSEGKFGPVDKSITITANTNPAQAMLRITGVIDGIPENGPLAK